MTCPASPPDIHHSGSVATSQIWIMLAGCLFILGCKEQANPSKHSQTSGVTNPFGGHPYEIPGTIEAENFDRGDPGVAYHDVDEKNLGVDYRGPTQVDIEARDDASNGHGLGWTRQGEWVVYTVLIQESGTYRLEIPVASNKQGGVFHVEFDGRDATGPIEIPDTGGWQLLQTISKDDIRLKNGVQTMKVVMDSDGPSSSIGDMDCFRFTMQSPQSQSQAADARNLRR